MAEPQPLRVALVLATSTGGVGQHVRALAAGLTAGGDTVRVHGPRSTEEHFGFRATGADFAATEISAGPNPVTDARAVAVLRRRLPDAHVVHAHGLRAGLVAGLACPRRTPLVVTWHNAVLGAGPRRQVLTALERYVARRADVTLGASADLVERARALGAPDARLAPVAAPPLPPPTRPAADVRAALGAADRPLVVAVGRLAPQKGYATLLDAARGWRGRERQPLLAIAGDGPLRTSLQERIDAEHLPVRLLGHRSDVADLLAACDVLVLPSAWEARSLVVQEAMRAGRPVVASAVGGIPHLVGEAGVLVPPGDSGALAAAVVRLLDDPGAAARLGAAARTKAGTWPTEADTLAQVRGVYGEITGR